MVKAGWFCAKKKHNMVFSSLQSRTHPIISSVGRFFTIYSIKKGGVEREGLFEENPLKIFIVENPLKIFIVSSFSL
jgi:hypothetical protein